MFAYHRITGTWDYFIYYHKYGSRDSNEYGRLMKRASQAHSIATANHPSFSMRREVRARDRSHWEWSLTSPNRADQTQILSCSTCKLISVTKCEFLWAECRFIWFSFRGFLQNIYAFIRHLSFYVKRYVTIKSLQPRN